jgi:hypothetical protein
MIFHYAGKYNGDESSLPYKEHHPNATPFKEPEDTKKLSLIANVGCILIMGILAIPFLILGIEYIPDNAIWMMIGGICGGLSLLPHELLHAICYKKDVYMYKIRAQAHKNKTPFTHILCSYHKHQHMCQIIIHIYIFFITYCMQQFMWQQR